MSLNVIRPAVALKSIHQKFRFDDLAFILLKQVCSFIG